LFPGDFVLAKVYHARGSEQPELYIAEVRVFMKNDIFHSFHCQMNANLVNLFPTKYGTFVKTA
jgi:hypothetical protein